MINKKESLEKIINLLETSLHKEGYITKRYSESNGRFCTTGYDCIIARDENGKEYTLDINERQTYNKKYGKWEDTNDLKEENLNPMSFYEFNNGDFGYYALIGAVSEDAAIEYYVETIADIEGENARPAEMTKDEARDKFLSTCSGIEFKATSNKEFNKHTLCSKPYLILIDSSLY